MSESIYIAEVVALIEQRLTERRGALRRWLIGDWRLVAPSLRDCGARHYSFSVQRRHVGRLAVRRRHDGWVVSPLPLNMGWSTPADRLCGMAAEVESLEQLRDGFLKSVESFRRLWVEHGRWNTPLPLGPYASCGPAPGRLVHIESRISHYTSALEGELELAGYDRPWRVLARLTQGRLRIVSIGQRSSSSFWRWCARRWGVK